MKVKVTESFRYEGEEYDEGDTAVLPDLVARSVVEKGYGEQLQQAPEVENIQGKPPENVSQKSDGKKPLTIPVKSGGRSWYDVTLFYPDPEAEEDWKKNAQLKIQKKKMEDGGVEEVDEPFYLSPSIAINISPVLEHLGIQGKIEDRKENGGAQSD